MEPKDVTGLEWLIELKSDATTAFNFKGQTLNFNKGSSPKMGGSEIKGCYRTGMVDKAKIRCYNCNEFGYFSTECRRPK